MLSRKTTIAGTGALLTALLAIPFALVMASPASAHTCNTGVYPNRASSQSGLDVACLFDQSATPTLNVGVFELHDSLNAAWHRGAARTVTVSTAAASTTITFLAGVLTAANDVQRPISGVGIAGGSFIKSVAATTAVISQPATAAGSITLKVEHTTARVIKDATVSIAAPNINSPSACFKATDVNKSVSGGPFVAGAKITAIGALVAGCASVATVVPAPTTVGTNPDSLTLGATTFLPASTTPSYTGNDTRQIAEPAGVTCSSSVTLTGVAAGGAFAAGDVGLKVQFINSGALSSPVVAGGPWKITAVNIAGTTTATLNLACPLNTAYTHVAIGEPGASAPRDLDHMATFAAQLNLNPALNFTSDDCNKNTYEGFELEGRYLNPGTYLGGAAPTRTIGQYAFPTSVLTFAAYVVPVATDTLQAGPHYDFVFPALPTSAAVCPIVAGTTTNKTAVSIDFNASTPAGGNTITPGLNTFPANSFSPTGSGNPTAPSGRTLDNRTSVVATTFLQKIVLKNGVTVLAGQPIATGCIISANTVAPTLTAGSFTGYGCGDG